MSFHPKSYQEALAKVNKRIKKASVGLKTPSKRGLKRGSMTKPIPLKMRAELSEDRFMQECCLATFDCKGRIEFHHNLTYVGKRVNEYGSILPVCHHHHEKQSSFKRELNKIMYMRMTDEDRAKYPKKHDWLH